MFLYFPRICRGTARRCLVACKDERLQQSAVAASRKVLGTSARIGDLRVKGSLSRASHFKKGTSVVHGFSFSFFASLSPTSRMPTKSRVYAGFLVAKGQRIIRTAKRYLLLCKRYVLFSITHFTKHVAYWRIIRAQPRVDSLELICINPRSVCDCIHAHKTKYGMCRRLRYGSSSFPPAVYSSCVLKQWIRTVGNGMINNILTKISSVCVCVGVLLLCDSKVKFLWEEMFRVGWWGEIGLTKLCTCFTWLGRRGTNSLAPTNEPSGVGRKPKNLHYAKRNLGIPFAR